MGLAELMKELRLLKGQGVCRYLLSWLLVFLHVCTKSKMFALLFVAWVWVREGSAQGSTASKLPPELIYALVQLLRAW